MADHKLLNEKIATWLEPASATLNEGYLGLRKKAILAIGRKLQAKGAAGYLLSVYGRSAEATTADIHALIAKSDPAFPADGRDVEVQCIVGAAVADVLANDPASDTAAALGIMVRSAEFVALKTHSPAPLQQLAERSIAAAARRARLRYSDEDSVADQVQAEFPAQATALQLETQDWPTVSQRLDAILANHRAATISIAKTIAAAVDRVESRVELVDEEFNTLWWSYSGRSANEDQPWSEIEPPELRAILSAEELWDEVSYAPAPPSSNGLLALAVREPEAKTTIGEFAKQLSGRLPQRFKDKASSVYPLTTVASIVDEFGTGGKTWSDIASKRHGIDVKQTCTLRAAAEQYLREHDLTSLAQ